MATRTTLTFLGAAGTVTGSKYLLTVGERRILVDSGMFQGDKELRLKNWQPFPVDPASISDMVLTHAHLDHVGYVPALVRGGFSGPIWCTDGTRQLAEIVLMDAAKLQEQEAAEANEQGYSKHSPALPLYTADDVAKVLPLMRAVPYDTDTELTGNHRSPGDRPSGTRSDDRVTIRLTRAAHILGSASVNVWTPSAAVLFSGDLGRHDHPVLKPRDTPQGAPYVLIETTYGDREHPEPANLPHEGFADVIRRTIARGGTVLVPAFAIDRTEVVLKTISDMERDGRIPDVPVYVNSPMGVRALRVYQSLADELRPDMRDKDFVAIPDLTAVESTEDSRALTAPGGHGPSVIISSSGMATGGRVLHHLEQLLPDARNAVVLTGYQGVGTRGRQLSEGATQIKIHGKYVPVNAEIYHDHEFSVHADCSDLMDWLRALHPKPTQLFCVHGEPDAAAAFAAKARGELGINAVVPRLGEVVVLDKAGAPAPVVRAAGTPPSTPVTTRATAPATRATASSDGARSSAPAATSAPAVAGLRYRLLTGADDDAFCKRVSDALGEGYVLHGSPAIAFDGTRAIVAQAIVAQAIVRPDARDEPVVDDEPSEGKDPDATTRVDGPVGQDD